MAVEAPCAVVTLVKYKQRGKSMKSNGEIKGFIDRFRSEENVKRFERDIGREFQGIVSKYRIPKKCVRRLNANEIKIAEFYIKNAYKQGFKTALKVMTECDEIS